MKKLLLLLVGVLTAFISQATNYEVGKTYYIDISDVKSTLFNNSEWLQIWDSGGIVGQNITATKVADNVYSWTQVTADQSTVYIKRMNGNDQKEQWTAADPSSNFVKLNYNNGSCTVTWLDNYTEGANAAPLSLIGDSYSPNDWNGTMKSNYDAEHADVLTLQEVKGPEVEGQEVEVSQYYIFAAQGKFALSNQTGKNWNGDDGWKKNSLSIGAWKDDNSNGIYVANLTKTDVESPRYAPDAIKSQKVYFRINPEQTQIECTADITKFGEKETELPVIGGKQFYLMGNFSAEPYTPFLLIPLGDGSYRTVISCTNTAEGWKDMIIYSENPDVVDEEGNPVRVYYGSNGRVLAPGSNNYNFPASNTAEEFIQLSNFRTTDENGNTQTYTVYFHPTYQGVPHGIVRVTQDVYSKHKAYYLSGDINVWSDVTNRNTDNDTDNTKRHGFFTGESNDNKSYHYLQDDPDNPWVRFQSKEDMEDYWRFQYVGYGPDGSTGNWYRLNLMARGASDLNDNVGRLGGQFKIIHVSLEDNSQSFGVNASSNADYWKKVIKLGVPFTGQKAAGRNFMLGNTVVENAVIWFLAPDDGADAGTECQVIILGEPNDLYVYYANDSEDIPDTFNGPKVYLNTSSQANNFPHTDPFREYDSNNNSVSPTAEDGSYDFAWEKLPDGADYYPYGEDGLAIHYNNVWRKKIPNSINHRTPMPFLTSVTPYEAYANNKTEWFPRVQIDCEDIWFIENGTSNINVFFRYADDGLQNSPNTEVYFNAWLDQYDESGSLAAPLYLIDNMNEDGKMTRIDKNSSEWELVADKYKNNGLTGDAYKEYTWFMAPKDVITTDYANAGHAMFITSYGTQYPSALASSSLGDRNSVALNGADLYYVVGGSSSRVGILYSHLNGTVSVSDHLEQIQIGAEFFARDHAVYRNGDLNTTIGPEVDYQFSVIDNTGAELLPGDDAEEWYDMPYYNWNVENLPAGLYRVKVRVRKLVNGKYEYYSSTDIYTIYPARSAE